MKKITFLLVVFIAMQSICMAQPSRMIDSLLAVLKTQKEDTNRVNTLNALAKNYSLKDNDSLAIKYANDVIASAAKLNYTLGIFRGYTTLGKAYNNAGNEELALKNHRKALEFAQQSRNKIMEAVAYNNIGYVLHNNGHATEALEYYKLSGKIYKDFGYKLGAAESYFNIGYTYYTPLNNFPEAIKWLTFSLNLCKEAGFKNGIASAHIEIGNCYESLGIYPEAIKNYFAALKISEETGDRGDRDNIAASYNNIGEIYNNQGKYTEAMKYYNEGLKVYEQTKRKRGISTSHENIGEMHLRQGNFSEALKHHLIALEIGEEIKNSYDIAYSYMNIGNVYFFQSNYAEALKNYFSAFSQFKKGGDHDNELLAKINTKIGETYFKMNNLPEARKHLNEALAAAKEFGGKKIIAETCETLAKIDSAAGNWPQAYEAQKLLMLYQDSLLNEENSKKITEGVMQYQFDKIEDSLKYQQVITGEKLKQQELIALQQGQSLLLKNREVALLNSDKQLQYLQLEKNGAELAVQKAEAEKKQDQLNLLNKEKDIQSLQLKKQKQFRNYLLIGLALLLVIASFGYYSYRTRQQLKLQMLRNKIASDLHDDVGSTLSSISMFSQMAQQQSKETIPLLDTIGDHSRKMLDAMADIVWTINPENDQFEKIVLRMRNFAFELLGAKNIDFEFNADEEVSKMKLSMEVRKNLYLIFKEATNNLVKYSGANKAAFNIKAEKNNLFMMIRDNGKGFDQQQTTAGNGLKNMKKRAEEIGAQFMIHSNPGNGTTIELKVAV